MSEENECCDMCCPRNSWPAGNNSSGTKSLDGVSGELLTLDNDLEIYHYSPRSPHPKRAIMVFTDVYGLQNRLFAICDVPHEEEK